MQLGMVGLGRMGGNMVVRLSRAGHSLVVYDRDAKAVADNAGVGFDQRAFFVLEIERSQLAGAVAVIANCSHDAVAIAALKLADKSRVDAAELVFERLKSVFPKHALARNVEITGSSTVKWHVATLVTIDGKKAVFDSVTPYHASVVNAAAKFGDIANLNNPPTRTAMVEHKESFHSYLGLLSQSSNIVEVGDSDDVFKRAAAQAA